MKKRLATLALCLVASAAIYAQSSDVALFNELTQAYRSEAYPSVIQCATKLQKDFPHSTYLAKSWAYKGESQYRLARYEEAMSSLDESLRLCKNDVETSIAAYYWCGRSTEALELNTVSLNYYYASASLYTDALTKRNLDQRAVRLGNLAFYRAAELYYQLKSFEQAIPAYEHVVSCGKNFTRTEYDSALLHLSNSYISTGRYKEQLSLFDSLNISDTEKMNATTSRLEVYSGEAHEGLGEYRQAYDIYCKVLNNADSAMASLALQKAYNVASRHQKDVGEEPGQILVNAQKNLSQYPELLSEVWTRLGIDAFNEGDNKKALSYFDNAESEKSENEPYPFLALIGIYRVEIAGLPQAFEILDSYSEKFNVANSKNYCAYLAEYTKWFCLAGNFEQACAAGNQAMNSSGLQTLSAGQKKELVYYYALSLYKNNQVAEAQKLLSRQDMTVSQTESDTSYNLQMLYARILSETNNLNEAVLIYESASTKKILKQQNKYDYAVALYNSGYYSSAFQIAEELNTTDSAYLAGLSAINRKDWKNAERYLLKYLKLKGAHSDYAQFYAGYAQFRLQQYDSALKTLSEFADNNSSNPLIFMGYYTGAQCAVQLGKYKDAQTLAELALSNQKSASQNQDAVSLLAEIYSETNQFENAIELLSPYSTKNDSFGVTARYQLAGIYVKKGDLANADVKYREIHEQFASSSLWDDASYRRAEMYYSSEKYTMAIPRFNLYIEKVKNGKFLDAANFYLADSYARAAQANNAIMQYLVFIDAFPESTYAYTAKKNLVLLYKEQGDYDSALKVAEQIVEQYTASEEAQNYSNVVVDLKHLAAGEDEDIYTLQSDYSKLGGKATLQGRIKGTELAEAEWNSVGLQSKGADLAKELFAIQSQEKNVEDECEYAARTSLILAQRERQNGEHKKAAEYYLQRAKFCRMSGLGESAAQALYGAVEAFDAGTYYSDAKSTYETLAELYPESSYTASAKQLIEN